MVLGQCRNQQQQTGKLLRGSHHHERGGGGGGQARGQPLERSTGLLVSLSVFSSSGMCVFPPLSFSHSVTLMTGRGRVWKYQRSPTRPRLCRATGTLVTWNSCVQPPVSLQKQSDLQSRAPHPSSDHQTVSHVVCVCVCVCVLSSLSPRSHLSTSLQSITHTGRDNEGEGGVSRSVFSLLFSLSLSLFLTCLPLVYLFSLFDSLRAELP